MLQSVEECGLCEVWGSLLSGHSTCLAKLLGVALNSFSLKE